MQSSGSDSQTQQEQNQRQQPPPPPQQQQWMPIQYPAAAMVMQHHIIPPQHYGPPPPQHYLAAAYHQYQPHHHHLPHVQQHTQKQQREGSGENKTIWIGDLHHWMDENYLHSCFVSTGEVYIHILFIYLSAHIQILFFFVHDRLFCDELKQKLHKLIALC
jgi:hypothetical protein